MTSRERTTGVASLERKAKALGSQAKAVGGSDRTMWESPGAVAAAQSEEQSVARQENSAPCPLAELRRWHMHLVLSLQEHDVTSGPVASPNSSAALGPMKTAIRRTETQVRADVEELKLPRLQNSEMRAERCMYGNFKRCEDAARIDTCC